MGTSFRFFGFPRLNISLSRVQTFVSLGAGLVSIIGALVAIPNFFKSGPAKGELVAIVQEAKTDRALSDATIEVLTQPRARGGKTPKSKRIGYVQWSPTRSVTYYSSACTSQY